MTYSVRTLIPVILFVALSGCETTQRGNLAGAYDAYHNGRYSNAYEIARPLTNQGDSRHEASYVAGLSAYHMGESQKAIDNLATASRSTLNDVSADANVTLGRIYAERGRHADAASKYLAAAPKLSGQAKANAYYYAAKSQQVIGQWSAARANFSYAKRSSGHAGFQSLIDNEFRINGWTLQVGAYSNEQNARTAAQQFAGRAQQLRMGSPRLVPATDKHGRRLVLVQVGKFTSQATADQAKRQLNPKAAVVPLAMAQ